MFSKSIFLSKLIALVAVGSLVFGATPAIGIVTASGHFTVERSQVWGNSTLFNGSTVETDSASSELSLSNGVKVQLGAGSRARIWENHVVLEKGTGQVAAPPSYEVDARGLKIRVASDHGRLRVGLGDRVEVTALNGTASVANGAGLLLASIPAGRGMVFAMQPGTVTHSGCLLYKDGHFILQDENTQEVMEVNGSDLAANTGNRVDITGAAVDTKPAVGIATTVLNVTSLATKAQGGCLSVASALDAATEVPAGATPGGVQPIPAPLPKPGGGGLSTTAKVLIIGGIAAGAGVGAALALPGKKSSTSP